MAEFYIPLIGSLLGGSSYSNGRLNGQNGALSIFAPIPPDGVSLRSFRIKGLLPSAIRPGSLLVQLIRTPKDDYVAAAADFIVNQRITGDHQFAETILLGPTGKNVVDNSVYNYTISLDFATSAPTDRVFVHELAFLYR